MIQLLICKEVKHGLPYRKKSEAMAQRYDSGGRCHTVGLKSDGTVVAVGNNEFGQCDVGSWRDIRLPGK